MNKEDKMNATSKEPDEALIVTEEDQTLCLLCFEEGLDEQDPSTHYYASIPSGTCSCCGKKIVAPVSNQ